MRVIALFLGVVVALPADLSQPKGYGFEEYLIDFGKVYGAEEYEQHRSTFYTNIAAILEHNSQNHPWFMAVNKFTDLTEAQQKAQFRGYRSGLASLSTKKSSYPELNVMDLPTSIDWRDKGAVTAVKNQGGCGSCWAFSATESIESYVFLASGKLPILSEQNMVDCTPNPNHCGGTGGCDGATMELGFQYVKEKGLALEADYPYKARTGTCDESKAKAVKVTGFAKLPENNYTAVLAAVATLGPISITVDASRWSGYGGGVFDGCSKTNVDLDHGVQLVGYGTDPTSKLDFWLVRNSWGTSYGEKGYIRVLRHDGGNQYCHIDKNPADGSGCDGGPTQITACGTCGILYDTSYPIGASVTGVDEDIAALISLQNSGL